VAVTAALHGLPIGEVKPRMGLHVLGLTVGLGTLALLVLLARLRMQDVRFLNAFQKLDPGFCYQCQTYRCSLSRMNELLLRYPAQPRRMALEAPAPLEFLMHNYLEVPFGKGLFQPYYRLCLDESRDGSKITVYRKFRGEALLLASLLGTGAVAVGALPWGYGVLILSVVGFFGLFLMGILNAQVAQGLEQLMQSLGKHRPDGGGGEDEQEEWARL
jgi:hypothetical protein